MRKYALSTQAAELDALRGEVERLKASKAHILEDAKQAREAVWQLREDDKATITQLRDRVAGLEEGLEVLRREATILCQNSMACAANHYGVDFSIFGMPGWLADSQARIEKAAALLTQNEVG
jgi:chromosome segregation ATPase